MTTRPELIPVEMTVYKIEADLIDVSSPSNRRHLLGRVIVHGTGGDRRHEFQTESPGAWHVGDRFTVMVEPEEDK